MGIQVSKHQNFINFKNKENNRLKADQIDLPLFQKCEKLKWGILCINYLPKLSHIYHGLNV